MNLKRLFFIAFITGIILFSFAAFMPKEKAKNAAVKRYLYVATPGIRDYLGFGGHGLLVFDMDNNHHFVKRIKTRGLHPDNTPSNVKGIAVSIPLNSVYIST